ncbi:hypothetical protein [Actinomadura geliboluensis]|nr:hypothetical protein [Actinomadura geliboluensis]
MAIVKGTYLGHLQTAKVVDEAAGRTENGEVRRLATGIKKDRS